MARPFDPFLWHESPHGREDQDESWSSADDNEAPFLCYQVALEHASVKGPGWFQAEEIVSIK